MTPRRLEDLLRTAAAPSAEDGSPRGRAAAVWGHIRRGWDPERIEWQRWLRRWWPWVLLAVIAAALTVALLPHGPHREDTPPPLGLFGENRAPRPLSPP